MRFDAGEGLVIRVLELGTWCGGVRNLLSPMLIKNLLLIAILSNGLQSIAFPETAQKPFGAFDPCERARDLAPRVAKLRQLPFIRELNCISADKETFSNLQARHIEIIIPKERLQAEEVAFKMLGLIPDDYSYAACAAQSSGQYIQAFYDIFEHSIVIPTDWEIADDILAHELVHALQDQHFDLQAISKRAMQTMDSWLAMASVVEGDARTVQAEYGSRNETEESEDERRPAAKSVCDSPPEMEDIDFFPYTFGALFAARVLEAEGFAALNEALRNPPRATAQILHRANYPKFDPGLIKRESPKKLVRSGATFALEHLDTLGQYVIRVMLGKKLDSSPAITAARGWRGDTLALYRGAVPADYLLIWTSYWENDGEAREFYRAFVRYLSELHAVPLRADASVLRADVGGNKELAIKIQGSSVVFEMRDRLSQKFLNK